ncbi:peptide-methionine (S)-S-oxide reductase MsrA [Gammaproteobacteria bacterium]|jgi:peptide methionine sulfoxide reductase msrA/msrB|nr:peptide-methionine (S)-S-oxide reductase MsrA [Gammaproteobacteria bacterium]MDC0484985.1 peptide-methionine (S)-S-oxide reductase MsrA [Gammaproteobacteria bacterium]
MKNTALYLLIFSAALLIPVHASSVDDATSHSEKIILGSGCFWGAEKGYEAMPGVIDAVSGYADGNGVRPTYREITKLKNKFNVNNHAEVVEVTYNTNLISTEELLMHYFESHDPTQINKQGNDVGTQYRSIILYSTDQQKQAVDQVLGSYQGLLTAAGYGEIATLVKPIQKFYKAEKYHQDYIAKNPNGYCPDHSTGVRFARSDKSPAQDNSKIAQGKSIVVIEPEGYCPYCEKFKAKVTNNYLGSVPLVYRLASQLDGLTIDSPTWATPTILFLEEGKEVFGHQGYMSPKDFYQALGYFKLGDSEAYKVAFQEGTDARFCKEYEIFKNTPDGVFVDKLSGAPLFDTRDRFNSSTGWLSFTKPVEGSVFTRPDNSYGMRRTEIRSTTSNIHLGHVFPDGPNGMPRYCINATVLEFVKRTDLNI